MEMNEMRQNKTGQKCLKTVVPEPGLKQARDDLSRRFHPLQPAIFLLTFS